MMVHRLHRERQKVATARSRVRYVKDSCVAQRFSSLCTSEQDDHVSDYSLLLQPRIICCRIADQKLHRNASSLSRLLTAMRHVCCLQLRSSGDKEIHVDLESCVDPPSDDFFSKQKKAGPNPEEETPRPGGPLGF